MKTVAVVPVPRPRAMPSSTKSTARVATRSFASVPVGVLVDSLVDSLVVLRVIGGW